MENLQQQQAQEIISSQDVQNLISRLETQNPQMAQTAKELQQNLAQKNFPDLNSELIASLSILNKTNTIKEYQLAKEILLKTSIKPSILIATIYSKNKTKTDQKFLNYYVNLLSSRNLIDKKLKVMQTSA